METPGSANLKIQMAAHWFVLLHQNVVEERNENAKSSMNRVECLPRMGNGWEKLRKTSEKGLAENIINKKPFELLLHYVIYDHS